MRLPQIGQYEVIDDIILQGMAGLLKLIVSRQVAYVARPFNLAGLNRYCRKTSMTFGLSPVSGVSRTLTFVTRPSGVMIPSIVIEPLGRAPGGNFSGARLISTGIKNVSLSPRTTFDPN